MTLAAPDLLDGTVLFTGLAPYVPALQTKWDTFAADIQLLFDAIPGLATDILLSENALSEVDPIAARSNLDVFSKEEGDARYLLSGGTSGGLTLFGGFGAGENLTLSSTFDASKGQIFLADPTTVGTPADTSLAVGSILGVQNVVVSDSVHITADPTVVSQGTSLVVKLDLNLDYAGTLGPASSLAYVPTNWAGWAAGPGQSFPRGVISVEGTTTFSHAAGLVGGGVGIINARVSQNPPGVANNIVGVNGVFIDNQVYIARGATINQSFGGFQPTLTSYGHLGMSEQPIFTVDATLGGQLNNIISCPFYSGAVFMPNTHAKVSWGYFIDDATATYHNAGVITGAGVVDYLVGLHVSPLTTGTKNIAIRVGNPDPSTQSLFSVLGNGDVIAQTGIFGSEAALGSLYIAATTDTNRGTIILDANGIQFGLAPITFTGGGFLGAAGNYTMMGSRVGITMNANGGGAGTGNSFVLLGLDATITYAKAGNVFGSAVLSNTATFKNSSGVAVNLGPIYSVLAGPILTADNASITASHTSVLSAPTTSVIGTGVLTVPSLVGLSAAGLIGAGTTVTARTAVSISDATGAGAIVTQVGIDIATLTFAGTNIGIRNRSSTQLGSTGQLVVSTAGNLSTSGTLTGSFWTQQDATATHGMITTQTLGVGSQALHGYDNSADTLPNWLIGRVAGLYPNVGVYFAAANGASDVNFIRFGLGAAQINSTKLGVFGATPVVQPTGTPAAGTDAATTQTLANFLRTSLLALGVVS